MFDNMDRKFYEKTLRPDRQRSYRIIASMIIKEFDPLSVIDIGCGVGWILYYLDLQGVKVDGIEPNPNIKEYVPKNISESINQENLEVSIIPKKFYDLAICLEVAEHIDKKYSNIIVKNICQHSNTILFSAATPGQGGVGHINEQPFEYWENIFNKYNFILQKPQTKFCRNHLKDKKVNAWYHRNIRVLKRDSL